MLYTVILERTLIDSFIVKTFQIDVEPSEAESLFAELRGIVGRARDSYCVWLKPLEPRTTDEVLKLVTEQVNKVDKV